MNISLLQLFFTKSIVLPYTAQRNIHHTHKVATLPQLKLNEKTKFKSTLSQFLRYTLTT